MDYFSHGLWSYLIFSKSKNPWLAVLFGLLPDSLSWMIFFFYNLIMNGFKFGPPVLNGVPEWVFTLYGMSHSLVVVMVVFLIVYIFIKRIPIYIWAWPAMIIFDVLTHTADFLPTPFLWPISNFAFPGISWGSRWFFISNWSLMIILLVVVLLRKKGLLKFKLGRDGVKKFLSKFTFWLHLPITLMLFVPFAIPRSIWPGRVTFHFWYFVLVILLQFVWGLWYYPITKKIDIICPLTTLTQWLRGKPVDSPKNYKYSFIAELFKILKIKVSYFWVNVVLLVSLVIVTVQFVFG